MAYINGKQIAFSVHMTKPTADLQEKEITANGEYLPDAGYEGFSKVIVNVNAGAGAYLEKGAFNIAAHGTQYDFRFVKGMTWGLFCETVGYTDGRFNTTGSGITFCGMPVTYNGAVVQSADAIIDGATYTAAE